METTVERLIDAHDRLIDHALEHGSPLLLPLDIVMLGVRLEVDPDRQHARQTWTIDAAIVRTASVHKGPEFYGFGVSIYFGRGGCSRIEPTLEAAIAGVESDFRAAVKIGAAFLASERPKRARRKRKLECSACGDPALGRIDGSPRCGLCCGGVDFDLPDR